MGYDSVNLQGLGVPRLSFQKNIFHYTLRDSYLYETEQWIENCPFFNLKLLLLFVDMLKLFRRCFVMISNIICCSWLWFLQFPKCPVAKTSLNPFPMEVEGNMRISMYMQFINAGVCLIKLFPFLDMCCGCTAFWSIYVVLSLATDRFLPSCSLNIDAKWPLNRWVQIKHKVGRVLPCFIHANLKAGLMICQL